MAGKSPRKSGKSLKTHDAAYANASAAASAIRGAVAMQDAIDKVLSEFWFTLPDGTNARLDERERAALRKHLEDAGYAIVPRQVWGAGEGSTTFSTPIPSTAQADFDRKAHRMIDRVTGLPVGRKPIRSAG
jgi:hypothetical protein